MTDIIAAIDHATGCQQCGKDLASSVSDVFCSEMCQRTWQAARVGAEAELEDEAWPCAEWGVSAATAAEYLAAVMRQVSATFTIAIPRHPAPAPTTHFTANADGTLTQNLPTDAASVITAGGRVRPANGMEWEAFGTITSGFTFEEHRRPSSDAAPLDDSGSGTRHPHRCARHARC